MGNFEKLSVVVIVVIIMMILAVAIYEWTGSSSEPVPAQVDVRRGGAGPGGPGGDQNPRYPRDEEPLPWPSPLPDPSPVPLPDPFPAPAPDPTPTPAPDPTPLPAPGPSAQEFAETVHVVAAGDVLGRIAQKYWHRASLWPRIVEANPGLKPESLRRDMKLKIPAVRLEATSPPPKPGVPPGEPAAGGERPIPGSDYTVRRGDTWESIAKQAFNRSERWPELYVRNIKRVRSQADLAVGLVLSIPR